MKADEVKVKICDKYESCYKCPNSIYVGKDKNGKEKRICDVVVD